MFHTKQILASLSALTMIVSSIAPTANALTVTEAVNSVQSTPSPTLPNVANPRGNIGYILANIFYGSGDGVKNGLIKPQYLDVAGINTWIVNGSNAYYGGTGSVGIGTSTPSASFKLDVTGAIRSSNGLTVSAGTVALPAGEVDSTEIANGSLLFADWNQNGCTTNQIAKWNGSAWACATDAGIGSEADPVWMAASGSYYTKTNLQTSGQSAVHWGNLTNVPAASTSVAGIVMLNDGTGSTLTTQAATANSVKKIWDALVAMIGTKVTSTGTDGYVAKFTSTGITNSTLYDNGTKIGLGTNTPAEALEVNGNIKLSGATPSYRLTNVADPIGNNDAANKVYVDTKVSAAGATAGADTYLENGSYYSEGGDPYFCRLNVLAGTTQRIVSVNQNKKCNSTSNLYCNAGTCSADATVLDTIKSQNQLISARENSSCSISDGQVYCWGYVGNGQKYLDYSISQKNSSYQSHSCAITGNGEVKCMGVGGNGQLGNGGSSDSATAVTVSGINDAVKIYTASAGYSTNFGHSCALLASGQIKCWGYLNSYGNAYSPIAITGISNAVDFSMTGGNGSDQDHWCAVLATGSVVCAGYSGYGGLGDNANTSRNWTSPTTVTGISNAVRVFTAASGYSTGYGRSCALLSDGTVKCWGYLPSYGQSNIPIAISGLTGVVDFSLSNANGSGGHWCAVLSTGQIKCSGTGNNGELGNGGTSNVNWTTPVTVNSISNAVKIYTATTGYSTIYGRSCALLSDGSVKCWGYLPNYGQVSSPVAISGMTNVVHFSMSTNNEVQEAHWCAVLATGSIMCAGSGGYGQLGNGSSSNVSWITPVTVSGISNAVKVFTTSSGYSTSYGHSCALLYDGQIKCWGLNGNGVFGTATSNNGVTSTPIYSTASNGLYYSGIGSISVDKTVPEIKEGITAATSVANGGYHSCAIEGGSVRCWGYNPEGQLGNNSTNNSTAPVGVFGVSTAKQIASGYMHSCSILNDGTVKCWGLGRHGQLGNGNVSSSTPVSVSSITDAKEITAGDYHTCAITGSGSVKCWGLGNLGQLGNGAKSSSSTPVTASGVTNAVRISAGADHTCALTGSGTVLCWGANDWGQLGSAYTSVPLTVPTAVSGITTAGRLGAGANHTCVVLTDNTLKCWGINGNSQQGTTAHFMSSAPTTLLGMSNILNIVGGGTHSCTITTDLGGVNCFGGNRNGQLGSGNTNTSANASLVNYPVDGGSGVTNYTLALCETRDSYSGNLGGLDGANSICSTQCGVGYKFARESELANFNASAAANNTYWIDRASNTSTNCQNWTDSSGSYNGASAMFTLNLGATPIPTYTNPGGAVFPQTNIISSTQKLCNVSQQLLCVRGVR